MYKKLLQSAVIALSILILNTNLIYAQCSGVSNWSPSQIYNGGDKAVLNGTLYQAKWWTQNETPTNSTAPWVNLGACSGSTNTGSCTGVQSWNSTTAYTGGTDVVFNNKRYRAKWWTQNNQPDVNIGSYWDYISDCNSPVISKTASLTAFSTSVGTPSAAQSFTFSGSNLSSSIIVTAPNGFEVSLTPTAGFATVVVINPTGTTINTTTVFVRFNPGNTGTFSGNVTLGSTNATTQNIAVSGQASTFTKIVCNDVQNWDATRVYTSGNEVVYNGKRFSANWWNQGTAPSTATPWEAWQLIGNCVYSNMTLSTTSLSSFTTTVGTASSNQSFIVNGTELIGQIIITAPSQFEISLQSNTNFVSSIALSPDANNAVVNQTIYVRYNPFSNGTTSGTIIVQTNGLAPLTVNVTGTAQSPWLVSNTTLYNNTALQQVGIGTSTVPSGFILGVNGNIIAKGVKVTVSGWPDYVFKSDYKLMSLSEVEQYIKKTSHLPNVPSEEEIKKDGVDVGEMNKILLHKIEEMTLYMIELEKKVKALEMK